MKPVERQIGRYIRQATRGLRGPRRQDAQQELRGALEDKIHRHRLLGLDESAAVTSALRDFGSASVVARDLNAVHTLPTVYRSLLLAGIGTLLGLQAVAQVPMVRAIPDPGMYTPYCRSLYEERALQRLPLADAAALRLRLTQPGERAKLEAECRANFPQAPNTLLSFDDLISALRKGGITVNTVSGFDGYLQLTFPGRTDIQGLNLSGNIFMKNGQPYVQSAAVINLLSISLPIGIPLRLSGLDNPVLEIASARVQLGTPTGKVRATDFYGFRVTEIVEAHFAQTTGSPMRAATALDGEDESQHYKVSAPDQTLFVTVSNSQRIANPPGGGSEYYLLRVRAVKSGLLPAPIFEGFKTPQPRIVNTPAELVAATAKGQEAVLVYRLNAADLRNLKLTAVPAKSLQPVP